MMDPMTTDLPIYRQEVYRAPVLVKPSAEIRVSQVRVPQGAPGAFFYAHSFMVGVVGELRCAVSLSGNSNSTTSATQLIRVNRGGSRTSEDLSHAFACARHTDADPYHHHPATLHPHDQSSAFWRRFRVGIVRRPNLSAYVQGACR